MELDARGFDSRQGKEICLYFIVSRPIVGLTKLTYPVGTGGK
jgi:hypothetical protein